MSSTSRNRCTSPMPTSSRASIRACRDQQAADRSHRSGDPLRDCLSPVARWHADGHAPDDAPLSRRAAGGSASKPGEGAWRPKPAKAPVAPKPGEGGGAPDEPAGRSRRDRRLRAPARPSRRSARCGPIAWWVGSYVLLRFGFTAPIPASVISIYMGIVSIAILAYVASSEERRDEVSRPLVRFMTDRRHAVLLGAHGRRHPGARGCERLHADERPARTAVVPADRPSGLTARDHGARQGSISRPRQSLPGARDVEPRGVPQARRERAPDLLPELRLLPRRQHGRRRDVRARASTRSRPTSPTRERSRILRETFCSGGLPREGPGCRRKPRPGTRPCRPGRNS
jgi:hypothetical protein